MKRARRTKIVATLGPASEDPAVIEALFAAGADVFRINMSHLPRERLSERVATIRSIEQKLKRPIAVLVDLQGPKLRVGRFAADAAMIENGQDFVLDDDPTPGDATRVHLPHPEILSALEPGHAVIVDDGKLRLVVTEVAPGRAVTRVVTGGKISNRKGVSLPDTTIPVAAMTEKDRLDLEAGLAAGADWIAVSFVQRPEDVAEVKAVAQGRALVMAKIEKPQAVTALDAIMAVADGLMVARGDLGVEMPLEQVPGVQKRITRGARRLGKPVVVATQMLESMISAPVPTRAEVSDVATAVYEGADAVMLSAESASGAFPIEAVSTMDRIAQQVERDGIYWSIIAAQRNQPESTASDAIAAAAHQIADTLGLKAVMAWTASGSTALRLARARPDATVIALTPKRETARRLALAWGTHPIVTNDASDIDDMSFRACKFAVRENFAGIGDRVIVVAGLPFGTPGATNLVRIATVTPEHAAKA
ncbi:MULTISPECIES: pyruvate kinase [Methylobacterium]|jgi:pyruvate kinase|uniref:Pyruvate kinase n=2 Tax=Methylobacterium TaxID=407 RepID=A0A0C6FQ18_9HYPH|nr:MULTISPECIES: pyruvate kinase [Methylobacterium]MBK3398248.1 pyruvate kinase [Methylobacterium ajmalii]MBK3407416.1 pyruvate kinase [Methylobacterium ajmalii]MBK3423520.1 pyruvate kinase [Methylobacterium ajmalii]MBZ6411941.1 pyruvate kinase [Methylobacterium sp.]SFF22625.1 pyruvate kinase [Methylobacterium sp. yr596]